MIEEIQKIVCQHYKITISSLLSPCRKKAICHARSIAIYLCRKYTYESLEFIGNAFNRKHPCILYNYEKIRNKTEFPWTNTFDNILRNELDFLQQRIPVKSNEGNKEMIEELDAEYMEITGIS